ncbi:MAG: sensory rhodopsin transducer [Nitrospirales bacterium]
MENVGHTRWAIAKAISHLNSHGPEPQFTSHETACLLNVSDRDAQIQMTVFYSGPGLGGTLSHHGTARRTRHIRFNDLTDPEPLPRGRTMRVGLNRT